MSAAPAAPVTGDIRTRLDVWLAARITNYLNNPGTRTVSPELASAAANDPPGGFGDVVLIGSMHCSGTLRVCPGGGATAGKA